MGLVALVIWWVLQVFFFAMIGRLFIDLALSVNRSWRPKGFILVIVESVLTVTDPVIKTVRRFIPPLRIGMIQFDLGWTLIVLAIFFLQSLAKQVA